MRMRRYRKSGTLLLWEVEVQNASGRIGSSRPGLSVYTTRSAYTSSIVTRRPTIAAARCRLDSVMSSFALRSRSTCVRLVFSSVAILFFEIFFFFMASASCHATTSLTACARASSKMPSSLRKSSDPRNAG